MFLVLEGQGTLRLDGAEYPIRAGDFIAVPPGKSSPHQIVKSSEVELKYLCVSTRELPEVVQYPDSGKLGLAAHTGAQAEGRPELLFVMYGPDAAQAGYWDGK